VITNPGFVSYRGSRIQPFSKDSFCGFVSWRNFQKIRFADSFCDAIFKIFDESDKSYESSQILSTIDLRIHTNPVLLDSRIPTVFKRFVLWIRFVLRCWKDSFCGFVSWRNFQKICFVDLFRDAIVKRFVSWIRFVRPKISKDSICFVSEGFVYESRILSFYPCHTSLPPSPPPLICASIPNLKWNEPGNCLDILRILERQTETSSGGKDFRKRARPCDVRRADTRGGRLRRRRSNRRTRSRLRRRFDRRREWRRRTCCRIVKPGNKYSGNC
jgi:hypothetical protein